MENSLESLDPALRAATEGSLSYSNGSFQQQHRPQQQRALSSTQYSPYQHHQAQAPSSDLHHTHSQPSAQNDQHQSPYTPQSLHEQQPGTQNVTPTGFPDQPVDGGKRPRACEACRGLKVRCEFEGDDPDGACKRCTKAKRNCVITQPSRKRQKKSDNRVAELEKKIDALTATLNASQTAPPALSKTHMNVAVSSYAQSDKHIPSSQSLQPGVTVDGRHNITPVSANNWMAPSGDSASVILPPIVTTGQKRKHHESRSLSSANTISAHPDLLRGNEGPSAEPVSNPRAMASEELDVIDRGMLTMQMAEAIFLRYTNKMSLLLPAVVFPQGSTVDDIRCSKPTLFLSVMTAASGTAYPDLQTQLNKELVQVYANRIIVNGEKSLELIQALLISCIWYWPPERFEQLKFYALIHMAAVMAIDLNINHKSKNKGNHQIIAPLWREHARNKLPLQDTESVEARRTWLGCYFLAANAAMGLRRQNLIRWSSYLDDCLEFLESSPDAVSSDLSLCQWIRSQHIAEEVGISFSMDDAFAVVAISDAKVQYALKGFERDLEKWSEQVPLQCQSPILKMSEHILSLYMHEVAMHVDHNVEEFKPPFTEESLRGPHSDAPTVPLTAVHINALSSCLTAIDGIFTTFLSIDTDTVRALPVMCFVRMAYTVVVLMKMYFAAAVEGSELGKVIDKNNMRVEFYLNNLLEHLHAAAMEDKSKPAAKFVMVVAMLKTWFLRHEKGENGNTATDLKTASEDVTVVPREYLNTPSQLLSNVATSETQHHSTSNIPYIQESNQNNGWPQQQTSNQAYMYSSQTLQPRQSFGNNAGYVGNIDPNLGILPNLDYGLFNADGFEQAMGLTMESFDPRYFADDAFFGAVMDSVGGNADYFQGHGQGL